MRRESQVQEQPEDRKAIQEVVDAMAQQIGDFKRAEVRFGEKPILVTISKETGRGDRDQYCYRAVTTDGESELYADGWSRTPEGAAKALVNQFTWTVEVLKHDRLARQDARITW